MAGLPLPPPLQTYPDHAIWTVLPLKRFKRTEARIRALIDLINKASPLSINEAATQMRCYQDFVDNMLTLCHEGPPPTMNPKTRMYKMQKKNLKLLAALAKLCEPTLNSAFQLRAPIVPLQSSFTVNLPANGLPSSTYSGFADDIARIESFDDNIEVLKSKEKPKKISVRGTDGRTYNFLCKREEKGDMRKNSRLMEFASVINRLFRTDAQARKRPKLNLRTYGVFPMTEECGLIEWVPHTNAFRHILTDLYKSVGIEFDFRRIREMYDECMTEDKKGRVLAKEIVLLDNLVKMFPAVFHRWFAHCFPDPGAWLEARAAFTVSSASWSVVGAMVGLGDRYVTASNCTFV